MILFNKKTAWFIVLLFGKLPLEDFVLQSWQQSKVLSIQPTRYVILINKQFLGFYLFERCQTYILLLIPKST